MRHRARWVRRALMVLVGVAALAAVYLAVTLVQVWSDARLDQSGPADAIVVLGAAQYDGAPSPVLRGRLDHAVELYQAGHAPVVVVTGGRQQGDRFTQAMAGYRHLRDRGIPDEALLLEVDGTSTYTELAATSRILEQRGLSSALLVSDGYHSKRLLGIASEVGIDARVSPTDTGFGPRALARETVAVGVGRLIGFRRLDSLG
ncbi:MAG: YdcF family protein [Acidimicrobiales bacterium]